MPITIDKECQQRIEKRYVLTGVYEGEHEVLFFDTDEAALTHVNCYGDSGYHWDLIDMETHTWILLKGRVE